jgi:hypothetical protein
VRPSLNVVTAIVMRTLPPSTPSSGSEHSPKAFTFPPEGASTCSFAAGVLLPRAEGPSTSPPQASTCSTAGRLARAEGAASAVTLASQGGLVPTRQFLQAGARLRSCSPRSFFFARPTGFEPVTYGSGVRADENGPSGTPESSGETLYSEAGETPVPGLSQDRELRSSDVEAALLDALRAATAAGQWDVVVAVAGELRALVTD